MTQDTIMSILKSIASIFAIVFIILIIFNIKGCVCDMRAGSGMSSHYRPFIGCVFEQIKTNKGE